MLHKDHEGPSHNKLAEQEKIGSVGILDCPLLHKILRSSDGAHDHERLAEQLDVYDIPIFLDPFSKRFLLITQRDLVQVSQQRYASGSRREMIPLGSTNESSSEQGEE